MNFFFLKDLFGMLNFRIFRLENNGSHALRVSSENENRRIVQNARFCVNHWKTDIITSFAENDSKDVCFCINHYKI